MPGGQFQDSRDKFDASSDSWFRDQRLLATKGTKDTNICGCPRFRRRPVLLIFQMSELAGLHCTFDGDVSWCIRVA